MARSNKTRETQKHSCTKKTEICINKYHMISTITEQNCLNTLQATGVRESKMSDRKPRTMCRDISLSARTDFH